MKVYRFNLLLVLYLPFIIMILRLYPISASYTMLCNLCWSEVGRLIT